MIRRHVLAALATGIEASDEEAGRQSLRRIDWVLRGFARRRLERALIDAALAVTDVFDEDGPRAPTSGDGTSPEAVRHVQQVAALMIAKVPIDEVRDRERVAAAYRTLPPARGSLLPLATIASGALVLALTTTLALYVWTRPDAPKRAYARPMPPPAVGAFKDGGVPLADPAIAELFIEQLTALVIESDRDRQNGGLDKDRKAHSIALIGAPAIATHGPALVKAWAEMLAMLDRWVHVPASSREFRDIAREFRHKVRAVSDQLAAAGIGYYLEGDVLTRSTGAANALIYTYRVEEVAFVTAGTQPRRVLSLRRLDRLNMTHTLLGMQSAELGDPVLLLDQIDEHVATHVLPVLAPDAPYELADETYQRHEGAAIAKIAGDAVRRELAAAFGPDATRAHQIAALLAERALLVEEWRAIMDRKNWRLARTDNLFLPANLIESLEGDVPAYQRRRATEIEEKLAELEAPRIASRCHQLVAATIRRHEAQHGLDEDREEPLRYPKLLEAHLGDATDDDGEPRRSVESARAELSAYTSQLANDLVTPQLSLWNVARFAFNDRQWGTSESYAAILIVEGLARQLKLDSPGPVIHDRQIDRVRLASLMERLAKTDGPTLRTAARGLWRELYGEDIVLIVDR
ncbi:MAG: hypothetical protein H0T42_34540 [Deltaproteobacteria bacterium]|nr:hypothetical protein [Deltaproteobacteria bacterium]